MKSLLVKVGVVGLALVLAIALALLAVLVQRTGPELAVTGNLCGPSGSELCYAPVLKGGFPVAFLFDQPGISVPDALFLEDEWRPVALLIDIAVYFAALLAAFHFAARYRSASTAPPVRPKPPAARETDR